MVGLTEQETINRRAVLIDENGERGCIDMSEAVKDSLVSRGLIYYCGHCTGQIEYAREYHTADDHTFRCIAEGGVDVAGIGDLLHPDDLLCDVCVSCSLVISAT